MTELTTNPVVAASNVQNEVALVNPERSQIIPRKKRATGQSSSTSSSTASSTPASGSAISDGSSEVIQVTCRQKEMNIIEVFKYEEEHKIEDWVTLAKQFVESNESMLDWMKQAYLASRLPTTSEAYKIFKAAVGKGKKKRPNSGDIDWINVWNELLVVDKHKLGRLETQWETLPEYKWDESKKFKKDMHQLARTLNKSEQAIWNKMETTTLPELMKEMLPTLRNMPLREAINSIATSMDEKWMSMRIEKNIIASNLQRD